MEYVTQLIGLPKVSLNRVFVYLGDFALHVHDHFIPHPRNNYHPHILGHRSLVLMSVLLLSVKIFTLSALSLSPAATVFSSAITVENIISLANQSRQAYSLPALTHNSNLDKAAQAKAEDMLAKAYFSHTTPEGKSPWNFIIDSGYSYLMAGENLAVNFTEAENVEEAWMNSPGHKANIINKNFQEIGIGISQGEYQGHTAIFVVQMFGTPAQQKIALLEEPTLVQTQTIPNPAKSSVAGQSETLAKDQPTAGSGMPVSVQSGEARLEGSNVNIQAKINGPAVKVVAYFGQQAIMLSPKEEGAWTGEAALSALAQSNATVKIKAFAMDGQSAQLQLANFSQNLQQNYSTVGSTPPFHATFLDRAFNPKSFETNVYLIVMAGLLSCLILAIAIKRHIQHLPLIANTSFVVIFAALLFWAG